MAYQDEDGFDNYNTASLRWTVVGTAPTYGTAYRRFAPPTGLPGQGISMPATSSMYKPLLSNQQTLIGKCAFYALGYPTATMPIMAFDSGLNGTTTALVWTSTGELELYTEWAFSGQALRYTSAAGIIAPNGWYGIEWLVTAETTATGILQVWVNGNQVINVNNIITSDELYFNRVYLGAAGESGGGQISYYDDFRVWDATGSTQNAPVGYDTRIITVLPNGAGASTQWTPNGAGANWQCVDDNPPNGGTTYVSGAAAGLVDAYSMQNPGIVGNVYSVVARSYVTQTGAGRDVEIGVSSGGVQSYGTAVAPATSGYGFIDACIPLDPNTGVAWLAAGANAAQHAKQETV